MSPEAIHGTGGAYVPCDELPAELPPLPEGAIVGHNVGFVAKDELAAGLPATPYGAIRGSQVGFVAKPCEEPPEIPSLTVFAGVSRRLSTSDDAIVFTQQFVPFGSSANNIHAATWSPALSLFVVVGQQGKLATSPDGVTWTLQTSSFGTTAINTVLWIPELALFVIGGGSPLKVATSPDGINWTLRTTGLDTSAHAIRAFAWAPGITTLVALGDRPDIDSVAVSSDGSTWTIHSMTNDPLIHGNCLGWSPTLGKFVSGGGYGNVNLSSNGTSWSNIDSGMYPGDIWEPGGPYDPPFTPWGFVSVAWSPLLGIFAMVFNVGIGGGGIATSPNGTTWTMRFDNTGSSPSFNVVVWSPGLELFLVGGADGSLYVSSDGIDWVFREDVLLSAMNTIAGPLTS